MLSFTLKSYVLLYTEFYLHCTNLLDGNIKSISIKKTMKRIGRCVCLRKLKDFLLFFEQYVITANKPLSVLQPSNNCRNIDLILLKGKEVEISFFVL